MKEELVSVVVITYNSAKTVIETLNSIYQQTYKSIELIVTDDCSTDNTEKIVKDWVYKHKERFVRCKYCGTYSNKGVVINCNKGLKKVSGKYIKLIAADDILLSDCIANMTEEIQLQKVDVLFGRLQCFGESKYVAEMNRDLTLSYNVLKSFSEEKLERYYLTKGILPTPASFYTRNMFEDLNWFDSRFPFWEDGPFYLKMIAEHKKVGYLDKEVVKYRIYSSSLGHAGKLGKTMGYVDYMFTKSRVKCFYILEVRLLIKNRMYEELYRKHQKMFSDFLRIVEYRLNSVLKIKM